MTVLYDEKAEAYHANAALGSTDIRDFLSSPRLFKDRQEGLAQKETPALLFGTACHMALLEPRRFASLVVTQPERYGPDDKPWNNNANICKAWTEEQKLAGRTIVSVENRIHLHYMHDRMPSEVRSLLSASRSEVTVRTKVDGIDAQCRVDVWNDQTGTFPDLKSIADMDDVEKAIYRHGYHIQLAWYRRVLTADGLTVKRMPLLFVEKQPPYRWRWVELDADYEALGDQAVDEALHGIQARNKSGCWDDPADLHLLASPPEWLAGEFTQDAEGIHL